MTRSTILLLLFLFPLIVSAQKVYVTKSGHRYHQKECQYTRFSSKKIDLVDAKDLGYTPCLVCSNSNIISNSSNLVEKRGFIKYLSNGKIQIIAFIILLLLIVFILRKKGFSKFIRFKKLNPKLTELETKILDILLLKEETLDTNRLNTILSLDSKSLDAQRKSRARFLNSLNEKLTLYLKTPEVIQRITIEEDKRMVYYAISSKSKVQLKLWYADLLAS